MTDRPEDRPDSEGKNPANGPEDNSEGYKVGPGKPPLHTRWQEGHSGNLSGRRKREETYPDLLKEELDRRVSIQENGKTVTLTMRKAWVMRVVNGAIQGDPKYEKILMMIERPDLSPRKPGGLNIYDVASEDDIPPH
jgi:hypothetical protein